VVVTLTPSDICCCTDRIPEKCTIKQADPIGGPCCILDGLNVSLHAAREPENIWLLTHSSGTDLSIARIPITYKFLRSTEMMWDAIDLSTCSINEVCVGIIIANLPPLHKIILGLLSSILLAGFATTMRESSRKQNGRSRRASTMHTSNGHAKLDDSNDDESERHILELEKRKFPGIMKTTHVTVRDDDAMSQQAPSVKQYF
jgi:hypothetical protein